MLKAKYRDRLLAIGVALAAVMGSIFGSVLGAAADVFPSRPITIVVPYAAGGLFDSIARALAESMRVALSQSVVIENVGGAGGSIALGRVARAAADGYTISVGSGDQFVVNAAIYPLQYDVVQDFEPVSLLMNGPNLIISKNEIPAKNLKELVAWLKANHANVAQGHNGAGGSLHLCGVELQRVTGASWPFVPYRGAAPALQDVIGGRIDVMCTSPASSLEMVRNGLVRGYAITGNTRLATAPDIPTVDEAGFPGLSYFSLGRAVRAQGDAQGRDCQAQCRRRPCAGRPRRACAARGTRAGNLPARPANARSARRAAKSRDREVVADHQGGEHQGGLNVGAILARPADPMSVAGPTQKELAMPALAGTRRSIPAMLGAMAVIVLSAATAIAQTYPAAPVRVIVPFGAGGATDVLARVFIDHLQQRMGQTFTAENRGGAGGQIAASAFARAPADGYTLMFTTAAPITIAPLLSDKVQYDPRKDFVPVALVAVQPVWLTVSAGSPFKTLADVVAHARDNPGKVTYGTSGVGTELHLAAEAIARSAGIQMVHVPFRGGAEVVTALMGHQVDLAALSTASIANPVRQGTLRALAVTSPQRLPDFPDVPSIAELGHPAATMLPWWGMMAPAGTPPAIVARLTQELQAASADQGVRERLKATFVQIEFAGPQEFSRRLDAERAQYGDIIRAARIRQD